jgi:GT2 family glycosyltransferase
MRAIRASLTSTEPMQLDTASPLEPGAERRIRGIAAVLVNWNRAQLTVEAVRSLAGAVDSVYVLDNDSEEADTAALESGLAQSQVKLIKASRNLGYAGGNNLAVEVALAASCDAVLIMNNDAFAEAGAVEALARHLDANPQVGVAMPTVVQRDGVTVLHGRCSFDPRFGTPGWEGTGRRVEQISGACQATDYVSGEAFLCRAEVIRECGLFDERFFCYYEDVDWSVRVARAGWRLEHVPAARFRHELGASGASLTGTFYRARNRILLQRYTFGRSPVNAAVRSIVSLLRAAAVSVLRGRPQGARQVVAGALAALRSEDR